VLRFLVSIVYVIVNCVCNFAHHFLQYFSEALLRLPKLCRLLLLVTGPDTCNLFGMTHCIALNDEEEVI
jgi:hypothetical protein